MSDTVTASAKGATLLILQQFGSRILTFAANQVLLRYLSPELLGVSAQLELYSISCLYFSRESVRIALQRQTSDTQTVVNLAYIAPLLGLPLSLFLGYVYTRAGPPPVDYFQESLGLFALATIVELLTEPCFAVVQQKLYYGVRASVESTATIARCLATCAFAVWASKSGKNLGTLPFAFGQTVYAFSLFTLYLFKFYFISHEQNLSILFKTVPSRKSPEYYFRYFSKNLTWLIGTISLQSAVKYILTQGDSILVVSLTTLKDQGAYALASNYGGLIARIVFQPIEESSRNLFAQLCAPTASEKKPKTEDVNRAGQLLGLILRLYGIISLYAFSFGPTLAPLLLRLVAGSRWTDAGAGEVLAAYCYYIPFLAFNGVTEAFVAAVAPPSELNRQSAYMAVNFAAFAGSAYVFLSTLQLAGRGLVFANCLNMALRITWNLSFIRSFFSASASSFDIVESLPSAIGFLGATVVPQVLKRKHTLFRSYGLVGSLAWSVIVGLFYTTFLAYFERGFIRRMYSTIKQGRS